MVPKHGLQALWGRPSAEAFWAAHLRQSEETPKNSEDIDARLLHLWVQCSQWNQFKTLQGVSLQVQHQGEMMLL